MKTVENDYTLTQEFDDALKAHEAYRLYQANRNAFVHRTPEYMAALQLGMAHDNRPPTYAQMAVMQNYNAWGGLTPDRQSVCADAARSGEPFIRTVCKIAARILFVLLLVGVAVGVMI